MLLAKGGERLSTVMMYLSTPEEGGRTVFPQIGVSVRPQAGTAVMWMNIRSGGVFDTRVLHMGCPVLRGDKWIANKLVLWTNQMFNYPCSIDGDAHYQLGGSYT